MREHGTRMGKSAIRALDEIDRMRFGLARRFREVSSPSERFAISREMARLLERRRDLLQASGPEQATAG